MTKNKFNKKQRTKELDVQKKKVAFELKKMNKMRYNFLLDKYGIKHEDIVIENGYKCKIMGVKDICSGSEYSEGYFEGMAVKENGEISEFVTAIIFNPEKMKVLNQSTEKAKWNM